MQIVAVVVLYKRLPIESDTIQSLARAFEKNPGLLQSIRVFVWDNSPTVLDNPILPFPFDYRYANRNLGVSGAYNRAADFADSLGCPWLLLLDHDTTLPENFLARMLEYSYELQDNPRVAAVAPFVRKHQTEFFFSPTSLGFFNPVIPRTFHGIYDSKCLAINSGTMLRIAALKEIGGYNEDFWLDLSDVYVFHQLNRRGKRLYVAGDLEIKHFCAMLDYSKEMSAERYWNFIHAEDAYYSTCKPKIENAMQPLRLMGRSYRQYTRYHNKVFCKITLRFLFHRLLRTKAQRLKIWKQQILDRDIPATPGHGAAD